MASGTQPVTRLRSEYRPRRSPFGSFVFDWDNYQSFRAFKEQYTVGQRQISTHHAALLDWTWSNSHSRTVFVGDRIRDLILTKLDIGNEQEWRFLHPLGHGGFGAVAAFERRDWQTGAVRDQVVAKTTTSRQSEAVDRARMDLPKEAALMVQTNDCLTDGLATLRHYKYYPAPESQWKFYFEYCPFGDLERLIIRYKAYGRYLPELFLWHLFYWLAKSVHTYANHTWRNIEIERWGEYVPGGYLLHCDIKPQNILLGPPDPILHDDISLYPIPRMADLGLADITSDNDPYNAATYFEKGTRSWMAPECRVGSMNPNTVFYPFGADPREDTIEARRKAYHPVSSRANVWAIGSVMFSAMTLKEPDRVSMRVDDVLAEREPLAYPELNETLIEDNDFEILPPQRYSRNLRDLIQSCLEIRPTDRPSEDELLRTAKAGYENFLAGIQIEIDQYASEGNIPPNIETVVDTDPDHKLYFIRNEIDSAPDNYKFPHQERHPLFWTARFVEDFPWVPPAWGKLWSFDMPINTIAPDHWNLALRRALERSRRDIRDWDRIVESARRGSIFGTGINAPGTFVPGRGTNLGDTQPDDHDDDDDDSQGGPDVDAPTAQVDSDFAEQQRQYNLLQQQRHQHNLHHRQQQDPDNDHDHHHHHHHHHQPAPTTIIAQPPNTIVNLLGLEGQPGFTQSENDVNFDQMSDVIPTAPGPTALWPGNGRSFANVDEYTAWLDAQPGVADTRAWFAANAPPAPQSVVPQDPSSGRMSGVDMTGVVRTVRSPPVRFEPYPQRPREQGRRLGTRGRRGA